MIDNSTPELARYDDSEPVHLPITLHRVWQARRGEKACNDRLGGESAGLQCPGDRYCILVADHPSGITHTAPDGTTW